MSENIIKTLIAEGREFVANARPAGNSAVVPGRWLTELLDALEAFEEWPLTVFTSTGPNEYRIEGRKFFVVDGAA